MFDNFMKLEIGGKIKITHTHTHTHTHTTHESHCTGMVHTQELLFLYKKASKDFI